MAAKKKPSTRKTSDFYGSPIKKGKLHKEMGVKQGNKIPASRIDSELAALKAKKNKTKAEVTKERELQFAKNARKFKH